MPATLANITAGEDGTAKVSKKAKGLKVMMVNVGSWFRRAWWRR